MHCRCRAPRSPDKTAQLSPYRLWRGGVYASDLKSLRRANNPPKHKENKKREEIMAKPQNEIKYDELPEGVRSDQWIRDGQDCWSCVLNKTNPICKDHIKFNFKTPFCFFSPSRFIDSGSELGRRMSRFARLAVEAKKNRSKPKSSEMHLLTYKYPEDLDERRRRKLPSGKTCHFCAFSHIKKSCKKHYEACVGKKQYCFFDPSKFIDADSDAGRKIKNMKW